MSPNQLWHFVSLSPRDNGWTILWVICLIYKMEMCWFEPLGISWVKSETGPLHRGQMEAKETGGHSRLVGGRYNNKETYTWNLSWALQNSRSLYPPSRFSRVYIEALMGFSRVSRWCQQHPTVSKPHPWTGSLNEKSGQSEHFEARRGLSNSPLYICTASSLYIHLLIDI